MVAKTINFSDIASDLSNKSSSPASVYYQQNGNGVTFGGAATFNGAAVTGAWTFNETAGEDIWSSWAGLSGPTGNSHTALYFRNPDNIAPSLANTVTWTLNIGGGVRSFNGTGIQLGNYLSTKANSLVIGSEGAVEGTYNGIFTTAATNVTNNGIITGRQALRFDGFSDFEKNGLKATDSTPDYDYAHDNNYLLDGTWKPDSNIGLGSGKISALSVINNAGAAITGIFRPSNGSGPQWDTYGVNNFSYATLTVKNSGTITGGANGSYNINQATGGYAVASWGALQLTNNAKATITGSILASVSGSSITNAGTINGEILSQIGQTVTLAVPVTAGDNNSGETIYTKSALLTDGNGLSYLDSNHNGQIDTKTDLLLTKATFSFTNSGTISGVDTDLSVHTVLAASDMSDTIKNTGTINGSLFTANGTDTITNSGTINGVIYMGNGSAGSSKDTIVNTGTIVALDDNGGSSGTLYDIHLSGQSTTVTNSGSIVGKIYDSGALTLTNNAGASIDGIFSSGAATVTNNGTINGRVNLGDNAAFDAVKFTNGATGTVTDTVTLTGPTTLSNSGLLAGDVYMGSYSAATNSGSILGVLQEYGYGFDTITNNGFIGGIKLNYAGTDDVVNGKPVQTAVTNNGTVKGTFEIDGGDLTITNNANIMADVTVGNQGPGRGEGKEKIINSAKGIVTGSVYFSGQATASLTNAGQISGFIAISEQTSTVTLGNSGLIMRDIIAGGYTGGGGVISYGDSTSSAAVHFTNTGTVMGSYNGSGGVDTIDNEKKIGTIDAAGGGDSVTNGKSGIISGDVDLADGGGSGSGGYVIHSVEGFNTLVNNGLITGDVYGGNQGNTITNTGKILGETWLSDGVNLVDNTKGLALGDVHFFGDGSNTFKGGGIAETVYMNDGGVDTFIMGAGDDTVVFAFMPNSGFTYDGGIGSDTLDFRSLSSAVTLTMLSPGKLPVSAANNLQFQYYSTGSAYNFETVLAGGGSDKIYGTDNADKIDGGGGDNRLQGNGGADILIAGDGHGTDTFVYRLNTDSGITAATRDIIYGFTDGTDVLSFNQAMFSVAPNSFTLDPLNSEIHQGIVGEVAQIQVGGQTIIKIDLNGDGIIDKHDITVALDGTHHLTTADFGFIVFV